MNNDQRNAFVNLTFSVKGQAKRCIDGPTINIPADEFLAGQVTNTPIRSQKAYCERKARHIINRGKNITRNVTQIELRLKVEPQSISYRYYPSMASIEVYIEDALKWKLVYNLHGHLIEGAKSLIARRNSKQIKFQKTIKVEWTYDEIKWYMFQLPEYHPRNWK